VVAVAEAIILDVLELRIDGAELLADALGDSRPSRDSEPIFLAIPLFSAQIAACPSSCSPASKVGRSADIARALQ